MLLLELLDYAFPWDFWNLRILKLVSFLNWSPLIRWFWEGYYLDLFEKQIVSNLPIDLKNDAHSLYCQILHFRMNFEKIEAVAEEISIY